MDYAAWYSRVSAPFRSPRAQRALKLADKGAVMLFVLGYVTSLGFLAATGNPALIRAIAVPFAVFALVSLLRHLVNRPRPYERHTLAPLIPKSTKGRSWPSRHMACAAVLAMEFTWLWPIAGAIAWGLCLIVAFTRIVGGVHYPGDVLAAAALGILGGVLGFYLIP